MIDSQCLAIDVASLSMFQNLFNFLEIAVVGGRGDIQNMAEDGVYVGIAEMRDLYVLEIGANGSEEGVHVGELRVVSVIAAGDEGLVVSHVARVGTHHYVAHPTVGAIMEIGGCGLFLPHTYMAECF